jgi:hypothetical protein
MDRRMCAGTEEIAADQARFVAAVGSGREIVKRLQDA